MFAFVDNASANSVSVMYSVGIVVKYWLWIWLTSALVCTSAFVARLLISWCSVKYPLDSNSVSVTYSSGITVKYPLSLVSSDTLVGISVIFALVNNCVSTYSLVTSTVGIVGTLIKSL